MQEPAQPPLQTLSDAATYLEGLINRERSPDFAYARLDLQPIEALLEELGRPQDGLSIIHVAGSKGKGSTCLFAESVLRALGERVGTFTSPHLESWVERFRIDGEPVAEATLVAAVERVRPIVDALRAGPPQTVPSFFDATTAIALILFSEAAVDRALVEVGLGGRLDSTNVVDPAVTCITSIELEHTDKLGPTEADIAWEKAGILKHGRPVIVGELRPRAQAVVAARAVEVGAPLRLRGDAFDVHARSSPDQPNAFEFEAREGAVFTAPFTLRAPGAVAAGNAAIAIASIRALGIHGDDALREAARKGLSECELPARIEVLAADPEVIVDAAHTAESARALASVLEDLSPGGFDLLLSVSSDKNLDALLDALLPATRRVWVTCAEPQRSLASDVLAERLHERAPALATRIVENPEEAARRARAELSPGVRLCATGSIYLAGVARRVLGQGTPPVDFEPIA
ncbi:MAG: hypothetical protein CL908_18190 [Deltaproteobacteria bacterium]|nr:hypothetical protein [Deltaproteobacteria bacterium]